MATDTYCLDGSKYVPHSFVIGHRFGATDTLRLRRPPILRLILRVSVANIKHTQMPAETEDIGSPETVSGIGHTSYLFSPTYSLRIRPLTHPASCSNLNTRRRPTESGNLHLIEREKPPQVPTLSWRMPTVGLPYSLTKAEFTLRDRRLIRIQSASLSYDPGLTILESQPTGSLILEFGFIGQHAVLEGYVEMLQGQVIEQTLSDKLNRDVRKANESQLKTGRSLPVPKS
ncbi:hypothetical protein B0H14DRAFT_3144790 [Mycena olivaceomarginata]|nr:hypothetical protein B0H14DRAFT_3144790 [Mycena olivaceomarginata]